MWNIGIYSIRVIDNIELNEEFALKRFQYADDNLTWKQKTLLKKYGTKMEALRDKRIIPMSARGKHFVAMCDGLVEPNDNYERAWKSYMSILEEEKSLAAIHQAESRDPEKLERHLQSLYLGDVRQPTDEISPDNLSLSGDHARHCVVCRGSGMKANGDSCDRCTGRGWIESH